MHHCSNCPHSEDSLHAFRVKIHSRIPYYTFLKTIDGEFSVYNGISSRSLSRQFNISYEEAVEVVMEYAVNYRTITQILDGTIDANPELYRKEEKPEPASKKTLGVKKGGVKKGGVKKVGVKKGGTKKAAGK